MNNGKTSFGSYVVIVIIVLIASVAFFYYRGTQSPALDTIGQAQSINNDVAGSRVYTLLGQIDSLNIDRDFFNDETYLTLRDYTVSVPALPVGRSNPFAPVPGLTLPSSNTSTR